MIPVDPVGLPGLAALMLGFLTFLTALFTARARSKRDAKSATSGRSGASVGWIIVQGIGIGIAGFGRIRAELDPLSTKAMTEAVVVLTLMLMAVWLFHTSSRAMGKNWALVARTRADHTLVQDGPFAIVRNPIYVALFLFMIAMSIGYGHTTSLVAAFPVFAIGTMMRVVHEERLLRAMFGAEYDAYAARVNRFEPGLF